MCEGSATIDIILENIQVPVFASTLFSHSFFLSAIHSIRFNWKSTFYKIH